MIALVEGTGPTVATRLKRHVLVVNGIGISGGWGLKALTGGIGPTVPLWSLKLALAYHSSGMGLACAYIACHGHAGLLRVPSLLLSLHLMGCTLRLWLVQ